MTVEATIPTASFTVSGIGPYPVHWPYDEDALQVWVDTDGTWQEVAGYIVGMAEDGGNAIYLTEDDAATHAGSAMVVDRKTPAVQIWAGRQSAREIALEAQLDRLTRTVQELLASISKAVRLRSTTAPVPLGAAGTTLMFDGENYVPGPNVSEFVGFEDRAAEAIAAANALSAHVFQRATRFTSVIGQTDYLLPFDPGLQQLQVFANGKLINRTSDYSVVTITDQPHLRLAAPPVIADEITIFAAQVVDYDPNENRIEGLAGRVALVAHIALYGAIAGQHYTDGSVFYFSPPVGHALYGLNPIADLLGLVPSGRIEALHFGPDITGATDATAKVQNFLTWCAGKSGYWNPGIYRLNGAVTLPDNCRITGVTGSDDNLSGTVLRQYGQKLFIGKEDWINAELSGLLLDLRTVGATGRTIAFALKAHQNVDIKRIRTIRYDAATVMRREPTSAATINTTNNNYDILSSACTAGIIGIGYEATSYYFEGDGVTPVINTGVVWPEQNLGSVTILKETADMKLTNLIPGTDYTVAYDGSNHLSVTPTVVPVAGEVWYIWPSEVLNTGRKPISNNTIRFVCDYIFSFGYGAYRWTDRETISQGRLLAAADGVHLIVTNPYTDRSGQGGDFLSIYDTVLSYVDALVSNVSTLRGLNFGPGSQSMAGFGVSMDLPWVLSEGGTNYALDYRSRRSVTLAGTIAGTAGSPVITGTGTMFKRDLTLIGSTKDLVEIAGTLYAIASIDSDTQITLSTNLSGTVSGVTINRICKGNGVSIDIFWAGLGAGSFSDRSNQMGRTVVSSLTHKDGLVTMLSGASSAVVKFTEPCPRIPNLGELTFTSYGAIGARSFYIDEASITRNGFTIRISPTAAAADYPIGWKVELKSLN